MLILSKKQRTKGIESPKLIYSFSYRSDGDYIKLENGYLAPLFVPDSTYCDQGIMFYEVAQPMIDALWQHERLKDH